MAFDTVRTNKMRSGLTVLGVVIGITSIVAMTALIRGFDTSLQESIRTSMGPTRSLSSDSASRVSRAANEFSELIKRPMLTVSDARALEEQATTLQYSTSKWAWDLAPQRSAESLPRPEDPADPRIRTMNFSRKARVFPLSAGRFLGSGEVQHRSNAVVLGHRPINSCSNSRGSTDRQDRSGRQRSVHRCRVCSANALHPATLKRTRTISWSSPSRRFTRLRFRLVEGFRGSI